MVWTMQILATVLMAKNLSEMKMTPSLGIIPQRQIREYDTNYRCSTDRQVSERIDSSVFRYTLTVAELKYRTILISNSDLADLSKIYWVLKNLHQISIEALICGYLEPKKLRAGLQNKAATPI